MAAFQEDELFEKAYEYYLSYQPEKALEYCDIFLHNFPDSSAKDAVLFWKAESLMQLKRTDEAIKIFTTIKEVFPESPFFSFIEKKLSADKNDSSVSPGNGLPMEKTTVRADTGGTFCEKKVKELQKEKEVLEGQLSEMNRLEQLSERGLSKALEDKNRMEALLENSKKINEDLSLKIAAIASNKNVEMKDQNYHQLETDTKNLEKSIALLSEKAKEADKERDQEKQDQIQALSRLSSDKVFIEEELTKKQKRIEELTAQGKEKDNQFKQLSMTEKSKTTKEANDYRKQAEAEFAKLQGERDALLKKSEELQERKQEIQELTMKTEDLAREKHADEALLKNLTAEKSATSEKLKANELRLAALEEELKKERSRIAELTGKGGGTEILAKELGESEEIRKKLQSQVDQCNEMISIRSKEKETLFAKLKETEETLRGNVYSLQKLKNDYENLEKTYDSLLVHEKNAISELTAMKDIIKQYETPVLKIGENQFSLKQILDDHRGSSEVIRKIHAHNIIWSYDSPYNDFIIEHVLLKKAGESGIKEDKALYNSLLKQYSLSENEKDYLVRYLIIDKFIKNKLAEIIADEKHMRKYYELNKERYMVNTEKKQVRMLSLKYSPQEELEKGLVAVDFQQQVSSGKSLETVYKYNSNVLSFDTVNMSELPDFVKEKVDGLKDGAISNIISYDNKFMILQMQSMKKEYRSYEDVYKEFREKPFDDPTTQAYLLQEWFNELRKEAGSIE